MGQQQIHTQADDDRRQPHQGVQQHDGNAATREATGGQTGPNRQAQPACDQDGRQTDLEGQAGNFKQHRVGPGNQSPSQAKRMSKIVHDKIRARASAGSKGKSITKKRGTG